MSSKRKCIVILLFIVLVTILFILYKRSQFSFGISYHCKYSVYEVHSKSFKNHSKVPINHRQHKNVAKFHIALLKTKTTTESLPLPEHSLPRQKRILYNLGLANPQSSTKYRDCPEGRVLTCHLVGEFGNILWEYMSLIAVEELYSDHLNMKAYTPGNMREWLEEVFTNIKTPEIKNLPIACVSVRNAQVVRYNETPIYESRVPYNSPIILGYYSSRYNDIVRFGLENVKSYLQFREDMIMKATTYLIKAKLKFKLNDIDDVTFIGMHFRGGNYNDDLKKNYKEKFKGPPTYQYYNNAMLFFNQTIMNVIFIFSSTDRLWMKENIPHLFGYNLIATPSDEHAAIDDFVILSLCNHSIISYGTYAAAAAFLAGGTTFVYDLDVPKDGKGFTLAIGITDVLTNWFLCNETECKFDIKNNNFLKNVLY